MGLDIGYVLSEERYHGAFLCSICKCLTSLDSFIASNCSHPLCKRCAMNNENAITNCPECDRPVGKLECLKEVQPLALRVLGRMRVKCPYRDRCGGCRWEGDYSKLQHHQRLTHRRRSKRSLGNSSKGPSVMTSQSSLASNVTDSTLEKSNVTFTPPLQLTVKVSQEEQLSQQQQQQELLQQQQQQQQGGGTLLNPTLNAVPEEPESISSAAAAGLQQEAAEPSKQPTDHHSHHERKNLPPEDNIVNQNSNHQYHHQQQESDSVSVADRNFAVNDFEKVHELTDDNESIALGAMRKEDLHDFLRQSKHEAMGQEIIMNMSSQSDATDVTSNVDSRIERVAQQNLLPKQTTATGNNNSTMPLSNSIASADMNSVASSVDPEYRSYTQPLAEDDGDCETPELQFMADKNESHQQQPRRRSTPPRRASPLMSSDADMISNDNPEMNSREELRSPTLDDSYNNSNSGNYNSRVSSNNIDNSGRRGGRRIGGRGRGAGRARGNSGYNTNNNNENSEGNQLRPRRRSFQNSQQQQQQQDAVRHSNQQRHQRARSYSPMRPRKRNSFQEQQHQQQEPRRYADEDSAGNWVTTDDEAKKPQRRNSFQGQQQQQRAANSAYSDDDDPMQPPQRRRSFQELLQQQQQEPQQRTSNSTYADEEDSRAWGMDDFSKQGSTSTGTSQSHSASSQDDLDSFLRSKQSSESRRSTKPRYTVLGLTEEESLADDNTYHRLMKMQQENDAGACEGSLLTLVNALNDSASNALKRGDYEHAINGFSKAIKALPDPTLDSVLYATLQTKCAEAYLCMNDYSQCIRYADEALEIHEQIPEPYLHKANAHLAMGKFEDAAVILTIGSKRVEHSEFFEKNLDQARQLIEAMKALECLKKAGMHSELIKASESLDDSLMANKHILLVRARAFLSLDQIDNAIDAAAQIIEMDHRNIEALIILTKSHYLGGNIDHALIECQKALKVDEKEATELYDTIREVAQSLILAERAIQNGNFKHAVRLSSQTIYAAEPLAKSSPLYRKLYLARSEANLYAENFSAAISNANSVLESLPESLDAWSIKIKSFEAQAMHTQLAEELNVVISGEWGAQQKLLVQAFERATKSASSQPTTTTENGTSDTNTNSQESIDHRSASPSENQHQMEGDDSGDTLSDSYDILGVRRETSLEEINEVYQSKVRKYSEEELIKNGFTGTERSEALEKLKLLQDSMVIVLSDQRSRLWDQGAGADAMVDMAHYLKDIATAAFNDKNFKSAAEGFAEAITALADPTLDPTMYQDLHIRCAEAHLEIGEFSKCIRFLDEALEVDDQIPEAYLYKARAFMHMNRFDDASIILEIGYKRCPGSKELQKQLDYTKQLAETIEALECLKINGLHSELIKVTDTLGEEMLSEKHILLARAGAFLALDQSDKAVEAATKIHEIDNSDMEALVILAKANYLEGNIDIALIECQKALDLGDQSQGVNTLYGMINGVAQALILADRALQNQNYKEACTLCTKTIHVAELLFKSSPLYRKLYLARSEANCYAGNYMQAVANANLVLESLPESINAWNIKIKSLESLGKYYQLVDELEEVLSGDGWGSKQPSLVEAYNRAIAIIQEEEKGEEEKEEDEPATTPTLSMSDKNDNEEQKQEANSGVAQNYYEILGVSEAMHIEEIKDIIRSKAREVTITADCSEAERAEAEDYLKLLQECLVFFLSEASAN